MWAWHFKANTLARASTHEATEKTQVFLDRCRCRTLASILYEYEGWGTLISKACIRFECLHVRFNPFFMSPFFKSPLLRAFLSRNVSTIGFARFQSISCKRNSDQQTKDCIFIAKRIRVNKAWGWLLSCNNHFSTTVMQTYQRSHARLQKMSPRSHGSCWWHGTSCQTTSSTNRNIR